MKKTLILSKNPNKNLLQRVSHYFPSLSHYLSEEEKKLLMNSYAFSNQDMSDWMTLSVILVIYLFRGVYFTIMQKKVKTFEFHKMQITDIIQYAPQKVSVNILQDWSESEFKLGNSKQMIIKSIYKMGSISWILQQNFDQQQHPLVLSYRFVPWEMSSLYIC